VDEQEQDIMDVKTAPGDVYVLNKDAILLYGENGIELRLNQRNLGKLRGVQGTDQLVRDVDAKGRRYHVAWDPATKEFAFEPTRGEAVRSPAWMFFEEQKLAA
jgi:hypothetical protein